MRSTGTGSDKLIGIVIGTYKPQSILAEGGMGRLYIVDHLKTKKSYVMKTVRAQLQTRQDVIDRFLREVQLSSMVSHPNIIAFIEAGSHEKLMYLILEYFPAKDLTRAFNNIPATPGQIVNVGVQSAAALAAAHAQGIVHRDIKPQNILVNRRGEVKVCDFGLAKAFANPDFQGLTQPGQALGSPSFMAPEQVRGTSSATPLADIYALGAVLYYCLTGRAPYQGNNPLQVMRQIGQPFPRPSELRPDTPPALEQVLLKAMAANPAERYADARQMQQTLKKLAG